MINSSFFKTKNIFLVISLSLLFIGFMLPSQAEGNKPTKKLENKKEEKKVEEKEQATLKSETLNTVKENPSDTVVLIKTNKGPIKIKLFTKEAPITTENFIDLVKKGFYDGTIFHRIVKGFVIQGGDPLGNGTGNYIDPKSGKPRYIKLEVGDLKWDKFGRVGMARTRDPNSASCQFFIALNKLPSLDAGGVDPYGYAVFGQVTEDTFDTIKKIANDFKPAYPGSEKPESVVKMESVELL